MNDIDLTQTEIQNRIRNLTAALKAVRAAKEPDMLYIAQLTAERAALYTLVHATAAR